MVRGIRKILRPEAESHAGAVAASLAAGNRTMEGVDHRRIECRAGWLRSPTCGRCRDSNKRVAKMWHRQHCPKTPH
jgi:hypothetical protein